MNAKDVADSGKTATMTVGSNQQTHLPVRSGSIGPDVIDVGRLYRDTGCFTYDPGFTSTANCSSRITYIDGDKGVLLYRGYPIEQLTPSSRTSSRSATCCCTASCRTSTSSRSSAPPSRATPWCTSR